MSASPDRREADSTDGSTNAVRRGRPGQADGDTRGVGREILALALPALGALLAEPLFVLVDSAIVGSLGTAQLAGLTVAATALTTVVGLAVFLAYATTAAVARQVGAGRRAQAVELGVDGIWLAIVLGLCLLAVGLAIAPWAVRTLGAGPESAEYAATYLRWSLPGLPGMLVVLAATGALRGLRDTRSTLVVAGCGAVINAGLNLALVRGVGMGIAGSGLGTAITQVLMAVALTARLVAAARGEKIDLRPRVAGVLAGARAGLPLLARTASLRLAILLTVWVAGGLGDVALAAHQIVNSVWTFAAYGLDALAIAAQALIGASLGAGSAARARSLTRICERWGIGCGIAVGGALALATPWLVTLFGPDPAVHEAARVALWVACLCMPLAGFVFVLDGVLMGAGDGRYLAWAGMGTLAVYTPCALLVASLAPDGAAGLAWLWVAFAGVFMGARALANGLRAHGDGWMRLGAG